MAETTADVRRDIEQTRERMSTTLTELEQRLNVVQVVRDHPWPALALAFGAGLALSASGADKKAAVATVAATKGSTTKIGAALDDIVANLIGETERFIELSRERRSALITAAVTGQIDLRGEVA